MIINVEEEPSLLFLYLMIALATNCLARGITECCRPQKTLPPVKLCRTQAQWRDGAYSVEKRNQFGGDAHSRTKIDGFASRCTSMHFYELQALPLAMTRRP